ncbi:MAG: hypothetical protein ACTFAK_11315 [Candidatus Electronema sp. VV]
MSPVDQTIQIFASCFNWLQQNADVISVFYGLLLLFSIFLGLLILFLLDKFDERRRKK